MQTKKNGHLQDSSGRDMISSRGLGVKRGIVGKVTWLNREPNYGSKEFVMATIVVGIYPIKLWEIFGSGEFFMLTIHVQTGNQLTTQRASASEGRGEMKPSIVAVGAFISNLPSAS